MCDQEFKKCLDQWETVLVEWVNCLTLSKQLQNISDLRKSDFLTNILQLLTDSVISAEQTLPKLWDFTKFHYPNIDVSSRSSTLSLLENHELIEICSILMHYTCIYDRRESLTVPLCKTLTGDVQLKIRSFLENFSLDTAQGDLEKVIAMSMGSDILVDLVHRTPRSVYQWQSSGDNQNTGKSPLQDFLKTPTGKGRRMQEKDKEIKRLKHELQMEKYEKEDIALELKEHKEKIKRLNQQINEKALIITKLHGELVALENRTPPHKPREMKEIEKLLRAELHDSQAYITLLQKELDELQTDKDDVTKKLRLSEEEACLWQDKAINLEAKCETMTDQYKQQKLELSSLRMNCNELSALLDEIRSSKHDEESSYVENLEYKKSSAETSTICYEDLAQSVVEVQLREAQHENMDLTNHLQEARSQSISLEKNLEKVKLEFTDLSGNFMQLQEQNEKLESKILGLKESQLTLKQSNKNLTDNVQSLTDLNVIQKGELEFLHNSLVDTKNMLTKRDELVASLQLDLQVLETNHSELGSKLSQRDESYNKLKVESEALQIELEEAIEKYNQKEFENESVKQLFTNLDEGIEKNLKHLENLVSGEQVISFDDKVDAFSLLLKQLEVKNEQTNIEKSALSDCKLLIEKLNIEISILTNDKCTDAKIIERANIELCTAKKLNEELEASIKSKEQRIKELVLLVEDLNITIADLESLKVNVQEKTAEVEKLSEEKVVLKKEVRVRDEEILNRISDDERMRILIKELENIQSNLQGKLDVQYEELQRMCEENDVRKNEMEHLRQVKDAEIQKCVTELDRLRNEYVSQNSEHIKKISSLSSTIATHKKQIDVLEADLKIAEDNCNVKITQLEDLSKLKVQIEAQYQAQNEEMQKKIDLLELTIDNLNGNVKKYIEEKQVMEQNLTEQKSYYDTLRIEKEGYILDCEKMHKEIIDLAKKLNSKEDECRCKDDVNSKLTQELLALKLELQNKDDEIKCFKEKSEILHEKKREAKSIIESMKKSNDDITQKINSLYLEMDILNQLKIDLSAKCDILEANMNSISKQLGVKKDELSIALENLLEFHITGSKEIEELKLALEEAKIQLEKANDDRDILTLEHDAHIKGLNNEIVNLTLEIEDLKCREIFALQEVGSLKEELNQMVNKYTDTLQAERDLKTESDSQITNLTESIHSMVEKFNDLDTRYKEVINEYTECKTVMEGLNLQKKNLERELVKQKESYENEFIAAAEQYKLELENLRQLQTKYEGDIEKLSAEISTERGSRVRIETELDKAKADLETVLEERAELLSKVESLILSNQQFNEEYKDLKIENENLLKESEFSLNKTQMNLKETVRVTEEQQAGLRIDIKTLKSLIVDLEDVLNSKKLEYMKCMNAKDEEIIALKEKIAELERNVARLEDEQAQLNKKIESEKELYCKNSTEKDDRIKDLEINITKLSCANDILETGKKKLVELLEEFEEKCKIIQRDKSLEKIKHEEEISSLNVTMKNTNYLLEKKANELIVNQTKLQEYETQIEAINKIVEALKLNLNTTVEEKNEFQFRLEMIEEDNDRKIKEQISNFADLKNKYELLKEEICYVNEEWKVLKHELENVTENKRIADQTIQEKQEEVQELQIKYSSLTSMLSNKDSCIASLQEELEEKMGKLEKIVGEKIHLEAELTKTREQLQLMKKTRDELIEKHSNLLQDMEGKLIREHDHAVEVKNGLLQRLENLEKSLECENKSKVELQAKLDLEKQTNLEINSLLEIQRKGKLELESFIQQEIAKKEAIQKILEKETSLKEEIQSALEQEKKSREFFELQLLDLKNIKENYEIINNKLKSGIEKLSLLIYERPVIKNNDLSEDILDNMIQETEVRIIDVLTKSRELKEIAQILEKDKANTTKKLLELEKSNEILIIEKKKLLENYNSLHDEKTTLLQENDKDLKCLENLKTQHEVLKTKYEQLMQTVEDNKSTVEQNGKVFNQYQEFSDAAKIIKKDIDKIIADRNSLENAIFSLKEAHIGLQIHAAFITETQHKLHYEQKEALDTIIEDIQKQFNRYSKMAYNVNLNMIQIFEKTITGILIGKPVNWRSLFNDLDIPEILDRLDDLKDNTNNTHEQLKAFRKSIDALSAKGDLKPPRVLKENKCLAPAVLQKIKDEDWKKKYLNVKQRLTLVENTKNNYEKKVKQLREENKKIAAVSTLIVDPDIHYKNLLQQHIQAKEEHEKIITEYDLKYKELLGEFERYKISNGNSQLEQVHHVKQEVEKIREAYSNVLGVNSKLELENTTLHKLLEERNMQLSNLHSIKEAYEKLFEENNKLLAEIDTLKYKRSRDRDEYVRLLKKEKDEGDTNKKLQELRTEYELKLEKMKDKMIQLYKEEVDKQVDKVVTEKDQNIHLLRTISQLQDDLHEANLKIRMMETERSSIANQQQNPFHQFDSTVDMYNPRDSIGMLRRGSTQSLCTMNQDRNMEERRYSTLPKNLAGMDVIEEVRICRRTSITPAPSANLEMEDEAEMFNNKYLADLKAGRCNIPGMEHDSNSRLSELAYRNSLCPPHLKSSYPAETQFLNPRKFRDDDLKTGNVELDDSMSTRLLPYEKHKKKDIGTTAYKKPGPPTPSKNGGRLSLQGNELHPKEVLRDANEQKTPKKTTPNRLKSLFSRSKDSSENIPVSPKGRRLSIFRKPR